MEEDKSIQHSSGASAADSSEHTTGVQSPQQVASATDAAAASVRRKEPLADGQPEQAAVQADKGRSSDRAEPQGNRHDPQQTPPAAPQSERSTEPAKARQASAQQEGPTGSRQNETDSASAAEPQADRRASRRSGRADRVDREDRPDSADRSDRSDRTGDASENEAAAVNPTRIDREAGSERADRIDRKERSDRPERKEPTGDAPENEASTARSARAGRDTRPDRADRSGRDDRGARSDRSDRPDRADRSERVDRTGTASENEAADRSARGGRENRAEPIDRSDRTDRTNRSDRSGRGDRTGHTAGNTPAANRTNRSETPRNARSGAPRNSDDAVRSDASKGSAARAGVSRNVQPQSRANASARAAATEGSTASARRSRTSEPARGSDGNSPRHRSWREYALQFLVVILGVMVTFIGSGLIERWRTQRQVKAVMHLVCEELKTDRQMASEICRSIAYDRRGMALMQEHGMDYRRVPVDSLAVYQNILGQIDHFKPRTDALEVLRTSGAITGAEDKVLLMKILECYSLMNDFSESVDTYNDLKIKAIDHLFSEGIKGNIGGEDPSESWQVIMSDPKCAAFIGSTGNFFKDYALPEGIVGRIDEVIGTLNEKYRFE